MTKPAALGGAEPAGIDAPPVDPFVRLGVPMYNHTVPNDVTAVPTISITAFAKF